MSAKTDFDCSCGSSFILCGHLWVIITEELNSSGDVIIVNLTSNKPYSDKTTILTATDHKFIKHDTVISYADAKIMRRALIQQRIIERDFEPRDKFENDVINRIQEGLIKSPRTPRDIKKLFTDSKIGEAND